MLNISEKEFYKYKESGKVFPVIMQINGDQLTPINIFYNLGGENKFLFESAEKGRYSFIGSNPYMKVRSCGEDIEVITYGKIERFTGKVLDYVKKVMDVDYACLKDLPFIGGAIGYAGYDVIRQYEKLPNNNPDEINIPEAYLMFYKLLVCYDHKNHVVSIIYNIFPDDQVDYKTLKGLLNSIEERFYLNSYSKLKEFGEKVFTSNYTKKEFCDMVEKAKEYIRKGDIFQVVLSQRLSVKTSSNPFDVYRRLRSKNPSPYLFYMDFEDFQVVGSSPESLVSVFNNKVTTNPIAGTRPRGKTGREDEYLKNDLLNDEKEIAEHVMLVDLGRNDIGKVSEFGNVRLNRFMEVDYYSHVMHIVSEVTGVLKKGFNCFDALVSCLPAGTVSGAPKIRAMEIIDELESVKRELYAGAVGYFSYNGNMNTCIAIRTVVIKEGTAYLQAGGGIVYDSEPNNEYEESLNKLMVIKEVL